MTIEPLAAGHNIADFDCGELSLNVYLQSRAAQHAKKDISRTYVLLEEQDVLGYHTLATSSVAPAQIHANVPREYPVPVVLLARLAVRVDVQNQALGSDLLLDALLKAKAIADIAGCYAVTLNALNERARRFYTKFGFQQLKGDDPLFLYLLMKKIRKIPPREAEGGL